MTEQEKQKIQDRIIVQAIQFRFPNDEDIRRLITIIDRLNKQLTEIVEAGEPFVRFYGHILYVKDENIALTVPPPDEHTDKVTYGEWSRLVQALKEVKDGD